MTDAALPNSGILDGGRHTLALRVYYEDTDFTGVVYHANYLRFFERGRTEFLRAVGIDQRGLHAKTGAFFVVRSMAVDFLRPALMDDAVAVETRCQALGGSSLRLSQRLLRAGEVLATALVTVVTVREGRAARLPEAVRQVLGPLAAPAP